MKKIRDYQLITKMGKGASATVWHAVHRGIKPCALKVFEGSATDPEARALFLNEMRTAMSFSHGSIVQVFDAGEDDGELWMACEWVDGISLGEFNKTLWEAGRRWPLGHVAHVVGRLLLALVYVHEFTINGRPMKVIHRDVKPGNVLVSAGGEVKLTDFGVAKMWKDDSHSDFRGTFRYVSVEHFRGKATQKSDLFGVGAILHELLTNRSFRAPHSSPEELYRSILDEGPCELDVDVPESLAKLHAQLLAPVEERIPTARAAHEILMTWMNYRPGELRFADLVREVLGRSGRSGVTMHDGSDIPIEALPRYSEPTIHLASMDVPVVRQRQPTELVSLDVPVFRHRRTEIVPSIVEEQDSSEICVNYFF